ncbi:putative ABC transport system substrate-binding protein [Rhizobiales bacterium GAS191]|nr:putative ABC transport system substrate-binding protein [Rhizobiales bacterium GAS188]SEE89204.1 putative ABC transport system substrate-binding protein [Rhizobiales bacterium GAS191]
MKLASVGISVATLKQGAICLLTAMGLVALLVSLASAQPVKSVSVGYLGVSQLVSPPPAFVEELRERGYEEGRNLRIEFRSAKGRPEALPKLAAELVGLRPDVLVGATTPSALALKKETDSIPIVIFSVGDPVASGLVQSFARPGGNVTGSSLATEIWESKRLQLVKEVLPQICCLSVLRNPSNQFGASPFATTIYQNAAKTLGLELKMIEAASPDELDQALAVPQDVRFRTALFSAPDGLFVSRRAQIIAFAQRQRIALFMPYREDAEAGALMSFGASLDDQSRLAADYVDRIIKGARPADLPVQQPTKFDLVLNLRAAKALGLTFPPSVVAGATELIE